MIASIKEWGCRRWCLLVVLLLQWVSFCCADWQPVQMLRGVMECLPHSMTALCFCVVLTPLAAVLCRVMKVPYLISNRTLGWLFVLLLSAYLGWNAYDPAHALPCAAFGTFVFCGVACCCGACFGGASCVVLWVCLLLAGLISMAGWFDIEVCPGNIMEVICTSMEDAAPYLTFTTFALLLVIMISSVAVAWAATRLLGREKCLTKLFTGLLFVTLALLQVHVQGLYDCPNKNLRLWPFGCTAKFIGDTHEALGYVSNIRDFLTNVPDKNATGVVRSFEEDAPVICILHIGESVRYDHLGFAGWRHDTTPWLGKQERLINFTDCTASAPQTDRATITIMTDARRDIAHARADEYPTSGGLMDFFAAGGFNCAAFWGSDLKDNEVLLFKAEALFFSRATKDIFSCLELPWKQADDILAYVDKHGDKDNFLLVNNIGSHYPFTNYDASVAPFHPTEEFSYTTHPEKDPELAERYINAYDNCLHYTDEYIRRLLTGLRGKPFIYIYISDHGEYLGDAGQWSRAKSQEKAFFYTGASHVPFFVYASPEFEAAHPHYKQAVAQLKKYVDMPTGQEHIFHTLLGLFGLRTPYYDATLDLSSETAQPYTGPHRPAK